MSDTDGLQEIFHTPTNPMNVDVPTRTCQQTDQIVLLDEDNKFLGTDDTPCGLPLVFERHGDEIQYCCTEHGWQATVFEERIRE